MSLRLQDLGQFFALTWRDPRQGLRAVLRLQPTMGAGLAAIALMAVVSALLIHLAPAPLPLPLDATQLERTVVMMVAAMTATPFTTALVQGVILLTSAVLIHLVGRLWGGQGQFGAAVVAVAWLQAIFVLLQALQLVALYVLPPLAGLIGLVSILLFFWLLTHFVTEVHGFATPVLVLIGIILTGFAVSFVLAFAMISILGPEAFVDV